MGIIARRWARQARRGLLRELGAAIALGGDPDLAAMSAPLVSEWSVHQHLEHLWRADAEIVGWLGRVRDGAATTDGPGSTVPGAVVLWLGMIPRGKGRAPQFTRPAGSQLEEIVAGLHAVREDVEILGGDLDGLAAAPMTRRHPLLGCYTAVQWLRFIHIHHVHHRHIIEDIRAACTA
jgi:hypothetical protein